MKCLISEGARGGGPARGLLAAALCALSLTACRDEAPPAAAARPVLAVELVSPVQQTWPDTVAVSGEIAAWQEAIVGSELGGLRLREVLVDVGDRVREGQVLATLNDEVLRADLGRLEAAVLVASANLAKAKADAARADRLEANSVLSGQAVEAYRTQAQVAEAELAAARANREAQAIAVRNAVIRAPDDGVISVRLATVGAVAVVGGELFRLLRQNRIEWRAEVPDELYPRLKPGTVAMLRTQNGETASGRLRELSPSIDPATRNGIGYVDLPAGTGLAPGMYVAGDFQLADRSAVVLPESAVVLRDGNRYLMKVDQEQRVHEVKVQTGRRQQAAIEVLGDIASTDRFVKSGGAFVNDGDLVRVSAAGELPRP